MLNIALVLVSLWSALATEALAQTQDKVSWQQAFAQIRTRLARELKPAELTPFDSKLVEYDEIAPKYKMLNVVWEPRDYSDYTNSDGIARARTFRKKYFQSLQMAHKSTGVPISIVVAIASIETNFGKIPRDHHVLSALASIAALSIESFGSDIERQTAEAASAYKRWSEEIQSNWHSRRVRFGEEWYEELKKFLILSHAQGWRADQIRGSWAGAVGYGQFLPSTLYGLLRKRGKTFQPMHLNSWRDNLVLIARHLKEEGWPRKGTEVEMRKAIAGYNASSDYVDAVLKISKELQVKGKKK